MFLTDASSTPEEFYILHSKERTLSSLSQRELLPGTGLGVPSRFYTQPDNALLHFLAFVYVLL